MPLQVPSWPLAMPPLPFGSWSPRGHLGAMNEALTQGRDQFSRAAFWNNFVYTFWNESPSALKLRFPPSSSALVETGDEEGGNTAEEQVFDVPTFMLAHFFATWQASLEMTSMQIHTGNAAGSIDDGILSGSFPYLISSSACIETIGLSGGLFIRQHVGMRVIFDPTGRIIQLELILTGHQHEEYLLAPKAAMLLTVNNYFSPSSSAGGHEEENGTGHLCRFGFPASVHRLLEINLVLLKDLTGWLLPTNTGAIVAAASPEDQMMYPAGRDEATMMAMAVRKKPIAPSSSYSPVTGTPSAAIAGANENSSVDNR